MKKIIGIAVVALMAVSAVHAEDKEAGNLGVGYQGIFLGDMINSLSVRYAPAPFGGQIQLGQGMVEADLPFGAGSVDADLLMLKGKFFYSLIQRQNSAFYLGASLGYNMASVSTPIGDVDVDGFSIAPLMGVEWNFQELPELGFNFEISYEINDMEIDAGGGATVDLGLYGINVSTGVHYYF